MYFEKILRDTETRFAHEVKGQVTSGEYIGGIMADTRFVQARPTARLLKTMLALYITKESKYYQSEELLERMKNCIQYLTISQRENGLYDLRDCNFYSAPDTGFTMFELLPAYLLAKRQDSLSVLAEDIKTLSIKALDGMTVGGFHTPNHRWVMASSLLHAYSIFGDEKYKACADRYLFEGIDCSVDGEYAERSAAIYNVVSNGAMMLIADSINDDSYNDYARRNLKMMMSYIDSDGSIFTNNSTRQDRGERILPTKYFHHYLAMGLKDNNKEFLAFANWIWDLSIKEHDLAPEMLADMILKPELNCENPYNMDEIPDYHNFYEASGIVRAKTGGIGYAIMEKNSSFLYLKAGRLIISMKVAACICHHKVFKGEKIIKTDDGYELNFTMNGWYYLPFTEKPETTDWWAMPNHTREKLSGPDAHFKIKIREVENGVEVTTNVTGIDTLPVRMEFAVDECDWVETEDVIMKGAKGGFINVKSGDVLLSKGMDTIKLSSACYAHNFVDGKFGSEGREPSLFYVYFTNDTPFEHKVTITKV